MELFEDGLSRIGRRLKDELASVQYYDWKEDGLRTVHAASACLG